MSNTWFQFKQFCIHHERCAMKVGTDGVLLGAWSPLKEERRILDVGTGSGLIALMLAQRFPESKVLGIDIDSEAVVQARENVKASPFAERVSVEQVALQSLESEDGAFDAIVCNPPFFEETLLPPDAQRMQARHTTHLTFEELIKSAVRLLCPGGRFCVVLPMTAFEGFHLQCFAAGLYLELRCDVQTSPKKAPKRTLACFCKDKDTVWQTEKLVLMVDGKRSEEYEKLTREFYLEST